METKTIKKLRKEQGLTQEQLGNAIGKSKSYIADLESGKRNIKAIAAETLVKLAAELGTLAEYIIDPPEQLDDTDFEWDKVYDDGNDGDYWLVVDAVSYSNKLNQYLFCIDGLWYKKIGRNAFAKCEPIDKQLALLKNVLENLQPNKGVLHCDYYTYKCVPKDGIPVNLGREITKSEFNELIKRYNLTDDDISNEFVDKKGAIYGKYMKIYTSIQIRVDPMEAIPLETSLRKKGIEAANIASGRVNIRVK
ncbi:MAG: helix-turn-helix transcriptional regulator [Oscillospiraceae bacterium]|nr:helix-turn-helix transcriptional regulator [Oscillospiraceae bacterium]